MVHKAVEDGSFVKNCCAQAKLSNHCFGSITFFLGKLLVHWIQRCRGWNFRSVESDFFVVWDVLAKHMICPRLAVHDNLPLL